MPVPHDLPNNAEWWRPSVEKTPDTNTGVSETCSAATSQTSIGLLSLLEQPATNKKNNDNTRTLFVLIGMPCSRMGSAHP